MCGAGGEGGGGGTHSGHCFRTTARAALPPLLLWHASIQITALPIAGRISRNAHLPWVPPVGPIPVPAAWQQMPGTSTSTRLRAHIPESV